MFEKLLVTAKSEPEAGMICELLNDEGIPNFAKVPGAGTLYMNAMNMGVKIYVSANDFERANELIEPLLSQEPVFIDFPGEDDSEECDE